MTRVLLVGLQPEAVDYSDPALPSGMDAKKIQVGIELGLKQMTDRGWQADKGNEPRSVSQWRFCAAHCLLLSNRQRVSFRRTHIHADF
jgi:hypothetical protein